MPTSKVGSRPTHPTSYCVTSLLHINHHPPLCKGQQQQQQQHKLTLKFPFAPISTETGEVINIAEPYADHAGQWGVGQGELSETGISVNTCYDWGNCAAPAPEGGGTHTGLD
jgi:hypothetical protein